MYNKEQIDSEFMKTHGFRKKGTAFFRVLASKILQVVKTEKGRGGAEIQFGVFSLYSELLPQWLTSSGCIPRYHVIAFLGRRSVLSLDPSGRVEIIGMKEQLDIFYQKAVPWLDSIITQEQLCDGQLIMDTCAGGNYRWNDMLKFAPFLKIRDWQCAEMVLPAILEQHGFTVSTLQVDTGSCKSDTWKNAFGLYNDDIELFRRFPRCKQKTTGDLHKEFILEKVRARDEAWAESYLEEIYQKNRKLLQEAKIF